ncbi:hypothetical protein BE17_21570 [Sorangium cellulosum]|uniref:Uncharacterized protein n=1 Tax=Sorangium cellulosum TaxID=56 RepID=A0A150S0G7_SORCE|nr:hypothetical protein BE17_21570 [Sorangium cellulosum]
MSSIDQEALDPEQDEQPTEPDRRPSWTRRLAPVILVAGALLAGSVLFKGLPQEREVELRLDDAATIVQLDMTWTDPSSGDSATGDAPIHGSSWHFAAGTAPRAVLTKVRLPDGLYRLEIAVDRTSGRDVTSRSVTLGDASRITFPVR